MSKYNEILKLFDYCQKIGITATIEPYFDGYAIRFVDGGDVVQHSYSYGSEHGYVEPAIGSELDYTAVSLKNAKVLIRKYKKQLTTKRKR